MNPPIRLLLATALFATLSVTASARIDRDVVKTFKVESAGSVEVLTSGGSVHVTVSADDTATITAHERIRADSDSEADQLLAKWDISVTQSGNALVATAERKSTDFISWGTTPVQVSFDVAVPAHFTAQVKTSGGNIVVTDRAAPITLRTSGGDISMGKISAAVDARTSGGDVVLDSATGDANLSTSGGNIKVGPISGTAKVSTSGGSIRIKGSGAAMHAETSGGNIVDDFLGPITGDCVLSTSGGEVKVSIDPKAAFHLDASTSGGSVKAHGLTITIDDGDSGRSHLRGTVNGGGPLLKLHSSGGDIALLTDGSREL